MADEYADDAGGDPAEAFDRLRGEVSLARDDIAVLMARPSVPDYEPTLVRTEEVLGVLARRIEAMHKSPIFALTPEQMSKEIVSAALYARREDQRLITEAVAGIDRVARDMGNRVGAARLRDEQNRWLLWTGLGCLVLGLVLYAVLAGPLARAMPASWQWPEHMAMRVLGEPTTFDAGQHLMRAANADGWRAIVFSANLVKDNRDALGACRKSATKAKKPVRCTIEVKAAE
ncbi:DUF6118 family protein [Sphingomonas sp. H39-1-10]|uniref:DUF6118 family protein n=1 Tax=Sphingomonas pollutisoli TaxID=3030829 RepID=UPI0023B95285|nr:DUF6118 family protein [Sphingomonas pollutisoli]MDF0490954.1 DUF6118 family protein [Sphingomonas pollutisoli]